MPEILIKPTDICNRALARIGGAVIDDIEDEDSDLARACNLIYATELEASLAKYPWPFALKTFKLSKIKDDPDSGWKASFALPGEALGFPFKFTYSPRTPHAFIRDYEIEAGEFHCDYAEAWARCIVRTDPDVWHPDFRKAIIVGIASALAIPISHDVQLAEKLRVEAYGRPDQEGRGGLIGQAITTMIAAAPPIGGMYDDNPLTNARY